MLALRLGAKNVAAVSQDGVYGEGLSGPFIDEAWAWRLRAYNFEWSGETTFRPLARRVAEHKPQLVYLAGLPSLNGRRLLEDLRSELGPHVVLVGSAGWFGPRPAQLGPPAEGMLIALGRGPAGKLPRPGKSRLL